MSTEPGTGAGQGANDPLLLEYDYFKHLSTIALVTLGVVLSSFQSGRSGGSVMALIALTLVAMSAVLGFGAMNHIITHRKNGKPLRFFFKYERGLASGAFAAGLGVFMSEIGNSLP